MDEVYFMLCDQGTQPVGITSERDRVLGVEGQENVVFAERRSHAPAGRGYQCPRTGVAKGGGNLQRVTLGTARAERGQHLENGLSLHRTGGAGDNH